MKQACSSCFGKLVMQVKARDLVYAVYAHGAEQIVGGFEKLVIVVKIPQHPGMNEQHIRRKEEKRVPSPFYSRNLGINSTRLQGRVR